MSFLFKISSSNEVVKFCWLFLLWLLGVPSKHGCAVNKGPTRTHPRIGHVRTDFLNAKWTETSNATEKKRIVRQNSMNSQEIISYKPIQPPKKTKSDRARSLKLPLFQIAPGCAKLRTDCAKLRSSCALLFFNPCPEICPKVKSSRF